MAKQFGVAPADLGMGITFYVLAAAVTIPVGPWLADRVGARSLFIGALIAFAVTSALCGMCRSLDTFVAARTLQGMAGALMGPVGQLILVRSVRREDLLRVMNIASAPMLVAPVLGPPVGGFITTYAGWPWIFYLNVPVGIVGAFLAYRILANPGGERRPFDLLGWILILFALGSLIYGLGEVGGGRVPRFVSVGLVVLGLAFSAITVGHLRRDRAPLISLGPTRSRNFRLTTLTGGPLIRVPINTLPFILPILLQAGFGMTAFVSGLMFLGHTAGDLAMKPFVTALFRRFGHRAMLIVNGFGVSAAIGCCGLFSLSTPEWIIFSVLFVSGCFRSFVMASVTSLAFSELASAEMSSATTIQQTIMQISAAMGVSVAVSLLNFSAMFRDATVAASPDCRFALVVVGIIGMCSLWPFARLCDDAGAEQTGYIRKHPRILVAKE